jgi:prepilin-type N-terminal cleavage/methylation domain-containing protein
MKKGFTLIELLVVISIIALLLSVLMPALQKVRGMAKTLVCQTHQKDLSTAWMAFAGDNDGEMVPAYNYRSIAGDAEYNSKTAWTWAPVEVGTEQMVIGRKPTLAERKEGIKKGGLFPYAQNVDSYHCPSDESEHFRSYSIADCMNGLNDYRTGSYHGPWHCLKKISQLKRPTETYVFVEENETRDFNNDSWDFGYQQEDGSEKTAFDGDPVPVWHYGSRSCFAFSDGHSEQRDWSEEVADVFKEGRFVYYEPETEGGKEDLRWLCDGWAR